MMNIEPQATKSQKNKPFFPPKVSLYSDTLGLSSEIKSKLADWKNSLEVLASAGKLSVRLYVESSNKLHLADQYSSNSIGSLLFDEKFEKASIFVFREELLLIEKLKNGNNTLRQARIEDCINIAAIPIKEGKTFVGYVVFGYVINQFISPALCQIIQGKLEIPYNRLWREIRSETPLPNNRFNALANLFETMSLQVMHQVSLKQNLAKALNTKNQFISSVTHELRTPLQALQLHAELLSISKDLPDSLMSSVRSIEKQVDHLAQLVSELFDFARIAKGKLVINRSQVSPTDLCREVVSSYEKMAAEKTITLTYKDQLPANFQKNVDPFRCKQVISNLIGNAIKFSNAGDSVNVVSFEENSVLCILVRDTGIGIAKADRDKIFEKFTQLNAKVESGGEGLGLGLSISREIIDLHGGTIEIDSKGPGLGTTVITTWP